jgi:hypothetical protein
MSNFATPWPYLRETPQAKPAQRNDEPRRCTSAALSINGNEAEEMTKLINKKIPLP